MKQYGSQQGHLGLPPAPSDRHEYGTNEVTLELVGGMQEAIDHIHRNGSSHTECIVAGALCCPGPGTCRTCDLAHWTHLSGYTR